MLQLLSRLTGSDCRNAQKPSCAARVGAVGCMAAGLLFLAPTGVRADEIVLKNGKIIQGKARVAGSRVVIQPYESDASILLPIDRIETIITRDAPSGAAESEPMEVPGGGKPAGPQPAAGVDVTHDAANVPLTEPRISPKLELPSVSYNFDPQPDAQVRAAVESVFPRILAICISELGMTLDRELPLNIKIFDDLATFESQKQRGSDIHYAVEGYYAVEEDTIVVWGNDFRQKMIATIYHEATHALLRREYEMVPSWIDEGLAEYFEGFRTQGSSTVALSPQYNNGWARRFLLEDQLMPLDEYLRLTNHQWIEADRNPQNLARITAWSLTACLMDSKVGRHALRRYLQAIRAGSPSEAIAVGYQELDAAYPGGIASLERDWRSWILEERKAQSF